MFIQFGDRIKEPDVIIKRREYERLRSQELERLAIEKEKQRKADAKAAKAKREIKKKLQKQKEKHNSILLEEHRIGKECLSQEENDILNDILGNTYLSSEYL